MSDQLERELRAAFAERAAITPMHDGLAEAAMGSARRLRRRRRAVAASSGLAVVLLAGTLAVMNPWSSGMFDDPVPPGGRTSAVPADFSVEFVVEQDDQTGILNADEDFISVQLTDVQQVARVAESYAVTSAEGYGVVTAVDSGAMTTTELNDGNAQLLVNGDASEVAFATYFESAERQSIEIVEAGEESSRLLDLSPDLALVDWTDSYLQVQTTLLREQGGKVPGPDDGYYLDDSYEWDLETAISAGFESVVLIDQFDTGFACVVPVVSDGTSDMCGYTYEESMIAEIETVTGDRDAAPNATRNPWGPWSDSNYVVEEAEVMADNTDGAGGRDAEFTSPYVDPGGEWMIEVPEDPSQPWTIIDMGVDEAEPVEFDAPEGALFPVLSYG